MANSRYKLCWKKTRFSPLPVTYATPQFWVGNDPFSEILLWCSRVRSAIQTQTKILDNACSCLQWGICTRWLLYFIYAMYNELSAAPQFIVPKVAKSSLITDRIPSRAQRTILPPHCHPFLFDGGKKVVQKLWALITWLKLLFWSKIRPWEARMFVTSFNEILLRPGSKICVCKLENICVRNHASFTSHT